MILSARAESIILSAGGTDSMILSMHAESVILSAPPAKSMVLSAPPGESVTLSVPPALERALRCSAQACRAESIILSAGGAESKCWRTYEKHERKEGAKHKPMLCLLGR
jgi:hypothetical protein